MTPETLEEAVRLAEEFIRRAKLVPIVEGTYGPTAMAGLVGKKWRRVGRSAVYPAAAKRASLDLTRALADLRRTKP
jgi:hypothetical protein